jgi:hypothetical protein
VVGADVAEVECFFVTALGITDFPPNGDGRPIRFVGILDTEIMATSDDQLVLTNNEVFLVIGSIATREFAAVSGAFA